MYKLTTGSRRCNADKPFLPGRLARVTGAWNLGRKSDGLAQRLRFIPPQVAEANVCGRQRLSSERNEPRGAGCEQQGCQFRNVMIHAWLRINLHQLNRRRIKNSTLSDKKKFFQSIRCIIVKKQCLISRVNLVFGRLTKQGIDLGLDGCSFGVGCPLSPLFI